MGEREPGSDPSEIEPATGSSPDQGAIEALKGLEAVGAIRQEFIEIARREGGLTEATMEAMGRFHDAFQETADVTQLPQNRDHWYTHERVTAYLAAGLYQQAVEALDDAETVLEYDPNSLYEEKFRALRAGIERGEI